MRRGSNKVLFAWLAVSERASLFDGVGGPRIEKL